MAVAAEELIRLSNLAVSAALDPGRWQVFLDTLSCSLGTRVCTQLIGYDDLTKATPLTFSSGYDPYILELYDEHYADKNPFAANFDPQAGLQKRTILISRKIKHRDCQSGVLDRLCI